MVCKLNNECLDNTDSMIYDIYSHKSTSEIADYVIDFGKYNGETIASIYQKDQKYLNWIIENKAKHYSIVQCYIEKLNKNSCGSIKYIK